MSEMMMEDGGFLLLVEISRIRRDKFLFIK